MGIKYWLTDLSMYIPVGILAILILTMAYLIYRAFKKDLDDGQE